jgi:hypothetical protein
MKLFGIRLGSVNTPTPKAESSGPPRVIPSTTRPNSISNPVIPMWEAKWSRMKEWFPVGKEFTCYGRKFCIEMHKECNEESYLHAIYNDNKGRLYDWYFEIESYKLMQKIYDEQFTDREVVKESTVEGTLKAFDTLTKNFISAIPQSIVIEEADRPE